MPVSIDLLNELVDRFATATKANFKTAGRKGSVVHLGPDRATDVLLAGDLHGNRGNYNRIIKEADLDNNPRRHLVLQEVLHGGPAYPNGGCMSHLVLEDVAKLKAQYPDRVHFLLSNHELSECTNTQITKSGISQNLQLALGMEHAYGPASKRIAQSFHEFILSCPLAIRLKNGVFICHSLPSIKELARFDVKVFTRRLTDGDLLQGGSAYALVWGRDYENDHVAAFMKLVRSTVLLTGHEPTPEGYQCPNEHQIIFDASGTPCWCCQVPLDRKLTQADLKQQLKRLE